MTKKDVRSKSKGTPKNISLNKILLSMISNRFFVVAMLIFAIDRVSKYIAQTFCPCILGPFFNVILSRNEGAAFGMLRDVSQVNLIFTFTTIIISLILVYLYSKAEEASSRIGLSLMLGGALGNLFDRLFYGAVIDVLDFHIGIWRFPTFNFADAAITAGAIMIILGTFLSKKTTVDVAGEVRHSNKKRESKPSSVHSSTLHKDKNNVRSPKKNERTSSGSKKGNHHKGRSKKSKR